MRGTPQAATAIGNVTRNGVSHETSTRDTIVVEHNVILPPA